MTAHTILVAITVTDRLWPISRQEAEEFLYPQLPAPEVQSPGVSTVVDSWWVAEDLRFDRSDCDSAVFVKPGNQAAANALLREHGLSY